MSQLTTRCPEPPLTLTAVVPRLRKVQPATRLPAPPVTATPDSLPASKVMPSMERWEAFSRANIGSSSSDRITSFSSMPAGGQK